MEMYDITKKCGVYGALGVNNKNYRHCGLVFDEENKLSDLQEFKQKVCLGKQTNSLGSFLLY